MLGRNHEEALEKAAAKFKVSKNSIVLKWGKKCFSSPHVL